MMNDTQKNELRMAYSDIEAIEDNLQGAFDVIFGTEDEDKLPELFNVRDSLMMAREAISNLLNQK